MNIGGFRVGIVKNLRKGKVVTWFYDTLLGLKIQ